MTLEKYITLGAPFLFCTSIILLPVQGTTPAFVLLLAFIAFLFISPNEYVAEIKVILYTAALFIFFTLISQFFISISHFSPEINLPTVSSVHSINPFQSSLFTQTIYLLPCLISYLIFRNLDFDSGMNIVKIAVWTLCLYGLYEVTYYLIFGMSGDFLSNRTYGEGDKEGSAFQVLQFAGLNILRLKSLTLEPSVFAYTVLPFFILFYYLEWTKSFLLSFLALLLSTSGTFILGFAVFLTYHFFSTMKSALLNQTVKIFDLLLYVLFAALGLYFVIAFLDLFFEVYSFLESKFSGSSDSGLTRLAHFTIAFDYWWNDLNLGLKIFGVGFGIYRPTNMLTMLLLNVGLVGLLAYISLFLVTAKTLPSNRVGTGLKIALYSHLFMSLASVPEFSVLSGWVLLGISQSYINGNE